MGRFSHEVLGEKIEVAGPSMPVGVLGLNGVPVAGDESTVCSIRARCERKSRESCGGSEIFSSRCRCSVAWQKFDEHFRCRRKSLCKRLT